MKWHHVQDNWFAFFDAILDKWPDADEAELEEVDGDQRAFVAYIAELTGQDITETKEEIRDWLAGELPPTWLWIPATTTIRSACRESSSPRARMNRTTTRGSATTRPGLSPKGRSRPRG